MSDGDATETRRSVEFDRPPMPPHAEGVQEILRDYLETRHEAGFTYVNANDIRRDLNWDPMPQKIGSNLRALEEYGVVEKWTNGSPATYKITLGESNAN